MKRHLLLLLAAMSANACGQTSGQPAPLIVGKAELLNTLKSANLKPGDLFYLRTVGPWQQGGCTIPSHTTVTGHVESLTSSSAHPRDTIIAIRFSQVPCSESRSTLMTPLLVSIKAPEPGSGYNAGAPQTPTLSGIFPSEARTDRPINIPTSNTSGATGALDANNLDQLPNAAGKPMKTGEVRGYHGIALTLPGRESTIRSRCCQRELRYPQNRRSFASSARGDGGRMCLLRLQATGRSRRNHLSSRALDSAACQPRLSASSVAANHRPRPHRQRSLPR